MGKFLIEYFRDSLARHVSSQKGRIIKEQKKKEKRAFYVLKKHNPFG